MINKLMNPGVILIIVYVITNNYSESKVIGSRDQLEELGNSLYNASDEVVVLDYMNLKSTIRNGKTAWIVEFYNSWCGYCQRFAPTWKEFAKGVVGWRDIVIVAAMDCSNEDNNPVCREYEIMRYPTIRYFSIGDKGIGIDAEKSMTEEGVLRGMIEQLQRDQQEGRGGHWSNIAPYRSNNSEGWKRALPVSVKFHFFLFEDKNSHLGSAVILDLHNITTLQIRRVTQDNEWLTKEFTVTSFPSLIAFNRTGSPVRLKLSEPTREGIVKVIKKFLKTQGISTEPDRPSPWEAQTFDEKNLPSGVKPSSFPKKPVADILYQADLENALRYSLEREIPLKKRIEGEQLEALKAYLNVLKRYFPLNRGNSEFLINLHSTVSDRPSITGENFKGLVTLYQQDFFPVFTEDQGWIGCSGSASRFRGYPCGLWTLFHTLTVNHAEAFEGEDPRNRSEGMVLRAMHGYIKNFFGCADCADHFIEMAKEKDLFSVQTVDSAILWLWSAHNEVNKRLSGDVTEDPEFPKVQYPRKEHCEACRTSDGAWTSEEVLIYLKEKYGRSGIHYGSRENSEIVRPRREHITVSLDRTVQIKAGWDFTVFDISILVVLYVASAAILVLVCVQFAVKKSMKKRTFIQTLFRRA